ncbi:MAG: hypothetical protein DI537_62610 [Stutzerimonas stutzeri]|nr:MAG: hypothetical protein DI537_62610 [Stutzerimonas stutzeri]
MTRNERLPKDLPSDDIQIDIALDWSPAQALAAYEWLEQIRQRIWLLYGKDIVQLLRADAPSIGATPGSNNDPPL